MTNPWIGEEKNIMPDDHLFPNRPSSLQTMRFTNIGFEPTTVKAGETLPLYVMPYVHFKGQFLGVASEIAKKFDILDLQVGNMVMSAGSPPVPAEFFAMDCLTQLKETAFHQFSRWDMPTAGPNNTIRLKVRNRSKKDLVFRAALFGIAER